MYNNKAKFITFEGCEGSGKTTQSKKLYQYLLSQNIPVILTREIGGTAEAESIRQVIFQSDFLPLSELLLIIAARFEHVTKVIIPALKQNIWVICDRFIDSTFCYQGTILNDRINIISSLHHQLIAPSFQEIGRSFMPDITFFIDLPPGVSLDRIKMRPNKNKFDEKELLFHQAVYRQFCHIAKIDKNRIVKIEADGLTVSEIHQQIIEKIKAGN